MLRLYLGIPWKDSFSFNHYKGGTDHTGVKVVGMIKWLTGHTSNLMTASDMGLNPVRCKQETLHSWLSTGWFQDWIQECPYKLIAFFTIRHKINSV